MEFSAIILAGGKSTRMGQDKGLMKYKAKTLIEYVIDSVKPLTNDLVIVTNNSEYDSLGYKTISDLYSEKGPLAGIYSGMLKLKNNWSFVLSCDTPNLTTAVLRTLQTEIDAAKIIVAEHGQQIHPLIGLYNKSCLPLFKKEIEMGNLGLIKAIQKCGYKRIDFSNIPNDVFNNINSPSDL